jgi:hypothetical protein
VQHLVAPAAPPPERSVYVLAPAPVVLPPPERAPLEPAETKPSTRGRAGRARFSLFEESQLQGMACGLLALSAADLFMTFTLLSKSPAYFESNPVAQWFFARWNMAGMVMFKFSLIAAVIVSSEFVERRRPGWGRFVLLIGCLGAAYAVYKGFNLYVG